MKAYAQNTLLNKLQGTWQLLENDHPYSSFSVFKQDSCFQTRNREKDVKVYWDTSKIFFSQQCLGSYDVYSRQKIDNNTGEYLIFTDIDRYKTSYCYWYEFISNDTFRINYAERPRNYAIYVRLKSNFLNKKLSFLKYPNVKVYYNDKIKVKANLPQNDIVEVLEEKSGWLRVRFYGKKLVEGWIRKGDVE